MSLSIRPAMEGDVASIANIYNYFITTSTATFEETPVTTSEMAGRIQKVAAKSLPWLVASATTDLVGYAYATPWRQRSAYRFSVETTVYVDPTAQRRGVGRALYTALFSELTDQGFKCAIGGITLPNAPSIALHESLGMRQVAQFQSVGFKFDRWLDVGYWQKLL